MSAILTFESPEGEPIKVEVDDSPGGPRRVSRDGQVAQAGRRLQDVLAEARPTVHAVLAAIGDLAADEREVEFGIKLTAEAGVMVAKSALEGNFVLRLKWVKPVPPPAGSDHGEH
jgi:hypothetical protein